MTAETQASACGGNRGTLKTAPRPPTPALPPGGALSMRAHAKGTRKDSPSSASPASLGIQFSPHIVMRPAARPRHHQPCLRVNVGTSLAMSSSKSMSSGRFFNFSISASRCFSFYPTILLRRLALVVIGCGPRGFLAFRQQAVGEGLTKLHQQPQAIAFLIRRPQRGEEFEADGIRGSSMTESARKPVGRQNPPFPSRR